jgi:hypothetical protein
MNWLYYLAEANIYLGVFYLAYCLFLNRDTHYQMSRAYLVFSCVISLILPVLQVGALRPVKTVEPVRAMMYVMPRTAGVVEQASAPTANSVINTAIPAVAKHFTLQEGFWYAYLAGAAVLLLMLCFKLYALLRLAGDRRSVNENGYRVIWLPGTDVAFSFFNCLFIGDDAPQAGTMMRHELVHIRQKHSADIVFLEVLKIVCWFNPVV